MKTARLCGISCILFLFWCGYITAQEKREVRQNARGTQAEQLSAEELFKQISPSVFVVESLDGSGQPIEQGSAVVIRTKSSSNIQNPNVLGMVNDPAFQKLTIGQQREALFKLTNDSAFNSLSNAQIKEFVGGMLKQTSARRRSQDYAYLITNYHVVKNGVRFRVIHGENVWAADLVTFDASHDLAELKVKGLKAPAVAILKSSALAVGESVYAIGAPEGLELTISQGLISGLRQLDNDLTIQTTAAISPGSSGGGLFDSQGRLVGITAAFLAEGENLNFAIPAELSLSLNSSGSNRDASKIASDAEDEKWDVFIGSGLLEIGDEKDGHDSMLAFQQAALVLQKAVHLNPDDADAWMLLALAYDSLSQHENAASAMRQSVRLKPDKEGAWQLLGGEYLILGQNENAFAAEQQAIALKPDDERAWCFLGSAYSNLGQYDKAVSAAQQAIALKADDQTAWLYLGYAYSSLGQYDKAVSAAQQAIALKADDDSAWQLLGHGCLGLGQDDRGANAEIKALNLNQKNEDAWVDLGDAFDSLRQFDKAVSAEQRAIALDDSDSAAWFDLGMAYFGLGQRAEVIKVYQKLKTLDQQRAADFFSRFVLPN